MEIFQQNGLYGLKNDCREVIISPQYREFYPYSCGLACVRNVQYQYAYIDFNNVAVVPFGKYIWIDPYFTCGYARVKNYSVVEDKQYWGIINTMGFIVVPCEYDNIWTLNEEYFDNLKAVKNSKEHRINLRKAEKRIVLDGLKYIKTYTIDEFKAEFNVKKIFVRVSPYNVVFFYYGTNIGIVSNDNCLNAPVISVVCNSAGKVFCLLHNKNNIGRTRVKQQIKHIVETKSTQYYSRDYDSYNDYNDYLEELRLDAFDGDESNYWNID